MIRLTTVGAIEVIDLNDACRCVGEVMTARCAEARPAGSGELSAGVGQVQEVSEG